ncbi:MAG TPA: alpha amylase C-terminal domain-containing protein [Acidimicrobiales bacterium]|nr:alpha amylase C-terminal domain-containing protein [Acidimicrobiales bacterium]
MRSLNHLAVTHPAIWELEYDPAGFRWIDANDADQNVLSFARFSAEGNRVVVCVANLSGLHRGGYRIGVPRPGRWEQVLDTASSAYGGDNPEQDGDRWAEPVSWHGLAQSLALDLSPFSVVWLSSTE